MLSLIFSFIFTLNLAHSEENFKISHLKAFFVGSKALTQEVVKRVDEGEVYTKSIVDDHQENKEKEQSLNFLITGLHSKNCSLALKKLSLFEQYKNLVDFIKESSYDENKNRVYFY